MTTYAVSTWKQSLEYHHEKIGTFQLNRYPPHGYEISLAPLKPLETNNMAFAKLKQILHTTGYLWRIEKNTGEAWVLVPFGHKYGYLLGYVAQAYYLANKAQQTLNEYTEAAE